MKLKSPRSKDVFSLIGTGGINFTSEEKKEELETCDEPKE